jgi:glycosyltransferase involved in cell wall biosynthesis
MKIALIADTFPPLRNSGAVQLRDLSLEFIKQGHDLTVILPTGLQENSYVLEYFNGIRIIRLRTLITKDIGYYKRTFNEMIMPFLMIWQLRKSPVSREKWDGVIFYSPSIFLAPVAKYIKNKSSCKCYLIIRDIFPEWALDIGLMKRGLPYLFFKAVALYQYSVADIIGVQTSGNLAYFDHWQKKDNRKLEVLDNWLGPYTNIPCTIAVNKTKLAGRKIFVYAGNMGVAQGMDIFIDLAQKLRNRSDLGFLFVGRGSELHKLMLRVAELNLNNTIFFDEINPDQIPDLYCQCTAGIVALNPDHKTHNIPGKFITYMQSGLPVLANLNAGNDLAELIRVNNVGQVCESNKIDELVYSTESLINQIENDDKIFNRCKNLFETKFSSELAVRKIITSLKK